MTQQRRTITNECDIDINAEKLNLLRVAREICPDFVIDKDNLHPLLVLFDYFLGIKGQLDLNKGLLLSGSIGTGKTTLMKIFSEVMRRRQMGFKVYNCTSVCQTYASSGDLDLFLENRNGYIASPVPICFDEIGREPKTAKYFGSELNVMQHILHMRYGLFQSHGVKTFATTNCDPNEIELFYGAYIRDRIREMMNIVVFEGESRRI